MAFWIAAALLSAAVTWAVTRPLLKPASTHAGERDSGLAVYKDQLKEIDADRERGVLSDAEAEAARAEVARRLIRVADAAPAEATAIGAGARTALQPIFYIASAAIPLASLGLYLVLGAPGLPGAPYRERLAASIDTAKTGDLIAKVEARLRDHPEDGRGWDVLAPVYMSAGRFAEAADAYGNAARILGESTARLEGFALASIRAGNGLVGDVARKALERALILEPKRQEPRIWLALAKEQEGNVVGALADYRALLNSAAPDTPWRSAVEARIAGLEGNSNGKTPEPKSSAATRPSPDAAAVAAMPAEERERVIVAMVEGLAKRLKANGEDLPGWLKLIRAYKVLGRESEARDALSTARKQFASDAKSLAELESLAKDLALAP